MIDSLLKNISLLHRCRNDALRLCSHVPNIIKVIPISIFFTLLDVLRVEVRAVYRLGKRLTPHPEKSLKYHRAKCLFKGMYIGKQYFYLVEEFYHFLQIFVKKICFRLKLVVQLLVLFLTGFTTISGLIPGHFSILCWAYQGNSIPWFHTIETPNIYAQVLKWVRINSKIEHKKGRAQLVFDSKT